VATEVTLPQLGESVTEGTITAWLVEVGDSVEADQPLFELSSDKIDTEVPAPASGVLTEIKVQVDETVDVGTVVAIIGGEGETDGGAEAGAADAGTDQAETEEAQTEEAPDASAEDDVAEAEGAASQQEREAVAAEGEDAQASESDDAGAGGDEQASGTYERSEPQAQEGGRKPPSGDGNGKGDDQLMSPLVRRMASEHDLDVSTISGSGQGGRITREDVEAAISSQGGGEQPAAGKQPAETPSEQQAGSQPKVSPQPERRPTVSAGDRTRVEDLSRIRQRIAAKMMESMQSSAQLTTVQEADVTAVMQLRERVKEDFKAREGVSLSPFVFLCRAAVLTLRNHPVVNALADWEAGKVAFHDYVNLGIAVDTEKGLLVPNVKGADDLSLAGLARAIKEAADKARGKGKLQMQDIEGGTFTVTNTGSVGVLIDTPILNYPEVAILGTGAIKKRAVVVEDDSGPAIAIREMVYLCLTYDHRLIDGADAARFVTALKEVVETHDWAAEIGY
jgi:2-oxoglutarate dehydrogenase E2 component (dihydrolipoamide succinyltransferase)